MWIEDILDPAYRKLQKLKELVREENASSQISAGVDEVIDLSRVRIAPMITYYRIPPSSSCNIKVFSWTA